MFMSQILSLLHWIPGIGNGNVHLIVDFVCHFISCKYAEDVLLSRYHSIHMLELEYASRFEFLYMYIL